MSLEKPIPAPLALPWIGNLLQVAGPRTMEKMVGLAQKYGDIYRLKLPGTEVLVVSGYELVQELADEERFRKLVEGSLMHLRNLGGDGLLTAHTDEPNWRRAHNILLPGFGPKAITRYIAVMVACSQSLCRKWRNSPGKALDVTEDMTRLTLEVIAQCGFDYTFHSFDRETVDPFVVSMERAMAESFQRIKRLPIQQYFARARERQYRADIQVLQETVDKVIAERLRDPDRYLDKQDFLSLMLHGKDRNDGSQLDEQNMRYQLLTFLVAGHETSSGLLGFALYFLATHPEVFRKAQAEVDRVVGKDPELKLDGKAIARLSYIRCILQEALRLWPTAPAYSRAPFVETRLGGTYRIKKNQRCLVIPRALHLDTRIWGEDAAAFRPERFEPENYKLIPPQAYKPFGDGARACIGQHFAMVEATIALAYIIQGFELKADPNYTLTVTEAITIKPHHFTLEVHART